MKAIDIHTHISSSEYDNDRVEVLNRALSICDYLIDIGSGMSTDAFLKSQKFSSENERVYFTAGVHPHDADTAGQNAELRKNISQIVEDPKCVAVGECGLDYYYNNSVRSSQMDTFRWHINLAVEKNLPLMIHTRDAEGDTQDLLASYDGPAVFHCFTGTQELANFGIKKGFYISFSGIVTFKNAAALREVFLNTPLENIVIETDAPFLAPVPMRGKRNESSFIHHTAEYLAGIRGMDTQSFIEVTSQNALKLFKRIVPAA